MPHIENKNNNQNIQQNKQNEKSMKDPHGGVRDTQARGRDKIQMTLEWIGRFHFSVCSVLAKGSMSIKPMHTECLKSSKKDSVFVA